MKRLSNRQIDHQRVLRLRRERRSRSVRNRDAHLSRLGLLNAPHEVRREYSQLMTKVTVIRAPKSIGLVQRPESLNFFARLRDAADDESVRVVIDLRDSETINAEACLILHAEIYRLRARKGIDGVRGLLPKSKLAKGRLRTVGLLPALEGAPKQLHGIAYNADTVPAQFIVVDTGIALDGGESLGIAKAFAQGLNLDDDAYSPIHRALNDALENISEHAYEGASASEERRWWACAISPPDEPVSYLLAYDLGVTIPATVPQTAKKGGAAALAALRKLVNREDEEAAEQKDLLLAAFDPTVTRRESGKGGRGLPSMRQLADQYPGGELTVWSGRAVAWTEGGKLIADGLEGDLRGTFVLWCIKTETDDEIDSD